ncbi:DNA recombination protein RmuC [Brevibacterium sp. 5221]|uniref:DNA recombination protein RmuC n=1 Tax=Brevibacterium rongguiense TaxID=2695267 RepID=A0A6N9H6G6_9MICO|nr:DNA recombination protein RmuC [Brevibacterium rongguiense]MYM19658.1 DNA recombination protein RmuC [Brevibacterium rongguiense]
METSLIVTAVVFLLLGLAVGALVGAMAVRARTAARLAEAQTARGLLAERNAALEADAALATELTAAVGPLSNGVRTLQSEVGRHERERIDQLARLSEQISGLSEQNRTLQESTGRLSSALHSTARRGQWGEVQLRRIVEHAGMLPHVDFDEQVSRTDRDGTALRPDLVVHLPGGSTLVVDAKAPLSSRLGGGKEEDHARALLRHVDALAARAYWRAFDPAPEFVVCFLPTDGLLSEAAAAYPQLIDQAMAKNVVLASPSTLLVLLKTAALNWRQAAIGESAQEVLRLGRELYERAGLLGERLGRLGGSLERAVGDYNAFIGSFESRFLVCARKFPATGISTEEIAPAAAAQAQVRRAAAAELSAE